MDADQGTTAASTVHEVVTRKECHHHEAGVEVVEATEVAEGVTVGVDRTVKRMEMSSM